MCRLRRLHFLQHSTCLARRCSTKLFSAIGDGDFSNPIHLVRCRCWGVEFNVLPDAVEGRNFFDSCEAHDCCVTWKNVTYCKWLNKYARAGNNHDGIEDACRNLLITHEYHPLALALNGSASESSHRRPLLGTRTALPDLDLDSLYTPDWVGGDDNMDFNADLYNQLDEARFSCAFHAESLYSSRIRLAEAIQTADEVLDEIQECAAQGLAWSPIWAKTWHTTQLVSVYEWEEKAVEAYELFLKRLRDCLTILDKLPKEGKSFSLGSTSISYDELQLADAGPSVIYAACDGQLKKAALLEDRFLSIEKWAREHPQGNRRPKRRLSPDLEDKAGNPEREAKKARH